MTPRLVRLVRDGTRNWSRRDLFLAVPSRWLATALIASLAWPSPSFALRTQAGLESETAESLPAALTGLEEGADYRLPEPPDFSSTAGSFDQTFQRMISAAVRAHAQGMTALRERRYRDAVSAFQAALSAWSRIDSEGLPRFQQEYPNAPADDVEIVALYLVEARTQSAAAWTFAQSKAPPSSGLAWLDRDQTGLEEPTPPAPAADPLAAATQAYFAQLVDPGSVERLQEARTAVAAAVEPSGIAPPDALARLDALWQAHRAGQSDVPDEIKHPLRRVHVGIGVPSEEALLTQLLAPAIAKWMQQQWVSEVHLTGFQTRLFTPDVTTFRILIYQTGATQWVLLGADAPLPDDLKILTVMADVLVTAGIGKIRLLHLAAGLEAPTLAEVQQALAALDGMALMLSSDLVNHAVVWVEDPAAAIVMQRLLGNDSSADVYWLTTSAAMAQRVVDDELFPPDRVIGLSFDSGDAESAFQDAGVTLQHILAVEGVETADAAIREVRRSRLAVGSRLGPVAITAVLPSSSVSARTYLTDIVPQALQFGTEPTPDRLTAAITRAFDTISRYL